MSHYRRNQQKGGSYFFTVVTHSRKRILLENIEKLRSAFKMVKSKHPFTIDGIVILPDHLHCVWTLPENDANYSLRWRLIKYSFSKSLETEVNKRGEKQVWQRRFWEHTIRNETDWQNHMDYIHFNPIKHGLVQKAADWKYSSFEKLVKMGMYCRNWGDFEPLEIKKMELE